MKNILALVCLLFVGCGGGGGGGSSSHVPSPCAVASPAPDRDNRWRSDISCLVDTLVARHPAPFASTSRADFDADVASLQADISRLADDEITVRLMRVVAHLRDGHTFVARDAAEVYPLSIARFPDGIHIVGTGPGFEHLAGRRIVGLGNMPIEEVRALVAELIPQENEFTVAAREARMLSSVTVMRGLRIADAAATLNLITEAPGGGSEETFIPAVFASDLIPFPANRPRSLARPNDNYWSEVVAERNSLYIQYNLCQETRVSMRDFAAEVDEDLRRPEVLRVVLDFRFNPGGDSEVINPLADVLQRWDGSRDPDRFKILIAPFTFSSAVMNVLRLRRSTAAEMLGETAGNNPHSFGQIGTQQLPYARLLFQYSTREFMDPADRLAPDRTVLWTWDDYRQGVDSVLVAAGL